MKNTHSISMHCRGSAVGPRSEGDRSIFEIGEVSGTGYFTEVPPCRELNRPKWQASVGNLCPS